MKKDRSGGFWGWSGIIAFWVGEEKMKEGIEQGIGVLLLDGLRNGQKKKNRFGKKGKFRRRS
jgi:hypothetical protein